MMKISWKFRIANWLYGDVLRNWLAIDLMVLNDIIRRTESHNNIMSKVDIKKLKSIMGDIRGIMTGKREKEE